MTTIIGAQYPWGCEIGADGRTSDDGRPFNGRAMAKVVARSEYLLAASGAGAVCDYITHVYRPPAYRGEDPYEFFVCTFSPHLQKALKINNFSGPSDDDDGWQLIAAVDGYVLQVASDGTVLQSADGIYGIGTGAAYAIGAHEAGAPVDEALEVAARFDIYTGEPFTVLRQVTR